jgi:hypothetical protein
MLRYFLIGIFLPHLIAVSAQKAPINFGKPSLDEVAMKFFEPDSTVDAAVLCEFGYLDQSNFEFKWMIRYKVFTKEGLNYLIMSVPAESKSVIKGWVFNMENGRVVKSKITNESIYEERLYERTTRMRIAPPDAREGSVIDVTYSVRGIPWEWNFQRRIPVLWSELNLPFSEWVKFDVNFVGYEPLSVSTNTRWVANNMPAFKTEPYINSEKNYMTTMFIDITEIKTEYTNYTRIWRVHTESWDAISDIFYESASYGGLLRENAAFLDGLADSIQQTAHSDAEMVSLALDCIRDQVKWNDETQLWADPENTLRGIFTKEHTGNSADINFLFMQLIKKLGIECYPMASSLRSEGLINPLFPSISRFNYTLSYVKIGNRFYIIDAADKHYPYDMLHAECLNQAGFVIKEDKGEWVDIIPEKVEKEMINCNLQLQEDGMMEGQVNVQYADYASAKFREMREEYKTEIEYLENLEKQYDVYIEDYQIKGAEVDLGPVTEGYRVEIDGSSNISGDLIQVDPVVIGGVGENPFKRDSRRYPVDFTFGKSKMYMMNLNIPEGYTIEQIPEPVSLVNSDRSAQFRYSVSQNGNLIQVMYQLNIKKTIFLPEEYEELKSFFQMVVLKEKEAVILKKARP